MWNMEHSRVTSRPRWRARISSLSTRSVALQTALGRTGDETASSVLIRFDCLLRLASRLATKTVGCGRSAQVRHLCCNLLKIDQLPAVLMHGQGTYNDGANPRMVGKPCFLQGSKCSTAWRYLIFGHSVLRNHQAPSNRAF